MVFECNFNLKQIVLGENYSTFSRRSRWCLKTKPVFILFRSFWGFSIFTPEWSFTGISSLRISWSIVREIPKLSISACPKSWARREIRHFHTVDQLNIWHRRWLWESAMGFPLITIPWVLYCISLSPDFHPITTKIQGSWRFQSLQRSYLFLLIWICHHRSKIFFLDCCINKVDFGLVQLQVWRK